VNRAVIVTGFCRAGGAAVAQVCHVLGYCMARTMLAPIAPDFRWDFEDAPLTKLMAENVEQGLDPTNRIGLRSFVRSRVQHAEANGFGTSIGFKSPLFSIGSAIDQLEAALELEEFESPTVIRVERSYEAIQRSIDRQQGAVVLRRWNGKIAASGPVPADLVIRYEELMADPVEIVDGLARRLGVADADLINRAAARVVASRY
jgi:hypothetical protein